MQVSRKLWFATACLFFLPGVGGQFADAEELSGRERAFFENRIRPVLVRHCYSCHSKDAEEVGGNLLLDDRESLLRGGQSGAAVVAGKPEASLLVDALRYETLEMPPDQPLPENVVNDFVTWIRRGAADPRVARPAESEVAEPDRDALWSFLPRRRDLPPEVNDPSWPCDPLDRFVLAKIEAAGLSPVGDADSTTLVRRLYVDLLGLLPTADEVEAFVSDHRQRGRRAVVRLVDSLLQQPAFGQRWGRHWLDVARYGESNGDDGLGRNATFPHAWRYRDYVIESFDCDVPYDRFVSEQIAGDLLPAKSPAQRNRQLIATGFLAIGAKPAAAMNKNFAMDVVDDQINAVATAIMGLSVACARCHDHKHDPIPTRDYYAMAGIFSSTETLYGLAANEKLTAPATPLHELTSATKAESDDSPRPQAMGVREKAKPANCKIHVGGETAKLGEAVPRGFLTAYDSFRSDHRGGWNQTPPKIPAQQSGRKELSDWLTHPDHPQTARVFVNRVWLHLFGQGIVATPDDFGVYGGRPSHPELLDHLATRLVREGWSTKRLVRTLVLSRTYALDSHCDRRLSQADPDNLLMARQHRRRLDAESIRDVILQSSGQLDHRPGQGSDIRHLDALINWPPGEATNLHRRSHHRSVYLCMLRHAPPPDLSAFDLPTGETVVGQREQTTLPTHSLFLLNNPFVVRQSQRLAARILADDREKKKIVAVFRHILRRNPSQSELHQAEGYCQEIERSLVGEVSTASDRKSRALASFCQALFATNEFRYID